MKPRTNRNGKMVRAALTACLGIAVMAGPAAATDPHSHEAVSAPKKNLPAVPPLPTKAPPAPSMAPPRPAPAPPPVGAPMPRSEHAGHGVMAHHAGTRTGVLGSYPMPRDASGTSWQPDAAVHGGLRAGAGPWSFMGHADLVGVYDDQSGPRGDEKGFLAGMVMGAVRRDGGGGTLNLRAMLSPDPFMGKRGYPLLLATGETADGVGELVDRQHPHELFMELAGSYAQRFAEQTSAFIYFGYPGEPALGPPAFLHRGSGKTMPQAPMTHHWLDSTHIAFGVVTAGLIIDNWKFEASQFTGREPDQHRFDFDRARFDSTSGRISFNPAANWSFQISGARINGPEQLEPDEDETRWTASAMYVAPLSEEETLAVTLAGGLKQIEGGDDLGGALLEATYRIGAFSVFGRAEWAENPDLLSAGDVEEIAAGALGAAYDIRLHEYVRLGIGGVATRPFLSSASEALETSYGRNPHGEMLFVRLALD